MSNIKVTEDHVARVMAEATLDHQKIGSKTTVVAATLANGFVVTKTSACVDAANYDHELGKQICMDRIRDKIWELEGFLLQQRHYEMGLSEEALQEQLKEMQGG